MEIEKLNLIPNGFKQTCYCSQGDNGRIIRFELFEGITPYTLDGSETITLKISKPNGEEITASVTNTELDYVDAVINSDMTELAGVAYGELTITKDGAVIGSQNFNLEIEADAYGSDVETRTATGVIATFTTNIIDTLFIEADIEPKQDLNGYDSPFIDSNEVNKVPYLKRAVNGTASRIGNKLYDKLVGGSCAFNQLIQNGNFENSSVWTKNVTSTTFTVSNNTAIITADSTSGGIYQNTNVIQGHKYFYAFEIKNTNPMNCGVAYYTGARKYISTNVNLTKYSFISNGNDTISSVFAFYNAGNVSNSVEIKNLILLDLTQMLGATIADYIYSLEQATAGEGVAFFRALGFDKDYYPYNSGELMSVKATAHITRDANNNVIGNYALDPNLELRGLLKLDENNSPYYDGDTYEASGAVSRKYGLVDLGSLTWDYVGTGDTVRFQARNFAPKRIADNFTLPNMLCSKKYNVLSWSNVGTGDKFITQIGGNYDIVAIVDSEYTDTTALKNSLSGVYLLYELTTPTTEQATAFTNPQNVIAGGYEEYTDSRAVPIPVGHETFHANICEISGATECNILRRGVNLWDEEMQIGTINSDGTINTSVNNRLVTKNYISVKPNMTYYIKWGNYGRGRGAFYDKNKNLVSFISDFYRNETFTTPENAYYLMFSPSTDYSTTYKNDISINYPATDETYHAYKGTEVTIDLDGTRYGGKVDTNGLLTVTRKSMLLDGSQTIQAGSNSRFYVTISEARLIDATNQTTDISVFSEGFAPTTWADLQGANGNKHCSAVWGHGVAFRDDTLTTAQAWTNFFTGSPLRFTYALAEPFTVQLDGKTIEALLGVNNVSADTGAVKVDYLYQA